MFNNDYNIGKLEEDKVYKIIFDHWDDDIKKVSNQYCSYDFEGNKFVYELKTRRNNLNDYDTTLFPYDKIEKSIAANKKLILLFSFYDGLYYIMYTPRKFKNFLVKDFRRYDRGSIDHLKAYIYIPTSMLKKIE